MKTIQERADVLCAKLCARHGLTINERLTECGFVYFPSELDGVRTTGRVCWSTEGQGVMTEINISPSWGFPTDTQREHILAALALYVTYKRQQKVAT